MQLTAQRRIFAAGIYESFGVRVAKAAPKRRLRIFLLVELHEEANQWRWLVKFSIFQKAALESVILHKSWSAESLKVSYLCGENCWW